MFKKVMALFLALALLVPASALGELHNTTANGSMTVDTTGDEVLVVEQALQALGYFTGTPDTTYDKETAAAVKDFQKANGMKQDGKVGDKTWARLTGLDGVGCIPKTVYDQVDSTTTTGLSDNGSMIIGSKGAGVKEVQTILQSLNYYTGLIDGIYNVTVAYAVRRFQERNGILPVDGKVGPKTLTALRDPGAVAADTYNQGMTLNGSLTIGSTGSDVQTVQQYLLDLGLYKGPIDSVYDQATASAVSEFQRKYGLTADGMVGNDTYNKLMSVHAAYVDTLTSGLTSNGSLKQGSKGPLVTDVKNRLYVLEYFNGKMDDVFDAELTAAVKDFQRRNDLVIDGIVGKKTVAKMFSADAIFKSEVILPTLSRHGSNVKSDVQSLQNVLFNTYFFYGSCDGIYGADTEAAVKAFQQAAGLTADGMAGNATRQKLLTIAKAKEAVKTPPLRYLTLGDRGWDVYLLQQHLAELNYLDMSKVTKGVFDSATATAISTFQKHKGISITGAYNSTTRRYLWASDVDAEQFAENEEIFDAQNPYDQANIPYVGNVLKEGSTGEQVKTAQMRLKAGGWLLGAADGKFGASTTKAVRQFQTDYNAAVNKYNKDHASDPDFVPVGNIKVDGIIGQDTWSALWFWDQNGTFTKKIQVVTDKEVYIPPLNSTLTTGTTNSSQLVDAQERLKAGSWLLDDPDGNYTDNTKAAVEQFQKEYNEAVDKYNLEHPSDPVAKLTESGDIDQDTWEALWQWERDRTFLIGQADQKVVIDGSTSVGANIIVMQRGSKGAQVVKLQKRLSDLGYYTGDIDGKYGPQTAIAVSKYQQDNKLKVDGKVGTQTLVSLQLDWNDAPVVTPAPPSVPEVFTDTAMPNSLSSGSKGNAVKKLQEALAAEGLYADTVDGYYGDSTKIAVMEYQAKYNADNPDKPQLPVNGVAGSATLTALGLKPSASPSTSRLEIGSTGEMVETVQQKLKDAGYYTGEVNGIFDNATEKAVKDFQEASGLKKDGIVGTKTWQALTGTYMGGGTLPETTVVMKRGSKGGNVFQLQSFLVDKGYLEATIDGKTSVDGKFGPATAVAVMKYQKAKGMEKVDGIVGAETYAKLKEDGLLSYPTK